MVQLSFAAPPTWGGKRKGAGRKRLGRARVAHVARPPHVARHPVHVTLRVASDIVSLRRRSLFPSVRDAIAAASRADFRVIHFSVQTDHLHFLVEADDPAAFTRGVRGLVIRTARAINRALRCPPPPPRRGRHRSLQLGRLVRRLAEPCPVERAAAGSPTANLARPRRLAPARHPQAVTPQRAVARLPVAARRALGPSSPLRRAASDSADFSRGLAPEAAAAFLWATANFG